MMPEPRIVFVYLKDGRRLDLSNRSVDEIIDTLRDLGVSPDDVHAVVHGGTYVPPDWKGIHQ